jgi:putative oxidoreductase
MHSSALPSRRIHIHHDPEAAQAAVEEAEADAATEYERLAAKREALYVAGRLTVAIVFIGSAVAKAAAFDAVTFPGNGGAFWMSIFLELGCGALLAIGLFARRAALALLLWLGVGVVFFHGDLTIDINRAFMMANLAIAGGLFVFVAHGGGLLSIDHWREQRRSP